LSSGVLALLRRPMAVTATDELETLY
jgi:hypothetical protein